MLTAALTEGPYFVDERLNRSDIRADPVSGAISAGVPLQLTFNVSRSANKRLHAADRGMRNTRNTNDRIYNSLSTAEKSALTLRTTQASGGYNGVIDLVVRLA